MTLANHTPAQFAEFTARLDRVARYLTSSKLHFKEGVLELNAAPFLHALEALPEGSPLSYLVLFLAETIWSEEDLLGRRVMTEALHDWCRAHP
jgi:hypothetical protein